MKRAEIITVDGASGEGGGQILRTSLSLSLVTGKPFRIVHIRAGRKKPGLLRQHLTAVQAATEVGDAVSDGAEIGSCEIVFRPEKIRAGEYRFAIGTAGSTTLVLQTVLPADIAERAFAQIAKRMRWPRESQSAGICPVSHTSFSDRKKLWPAVRTASEFAMRITGLPCCCPTLRAVSRSGERCP